MKKTLMVLTFALCATFVFAQTATPRMKEFKAPTTAAQVQNDYSSSLFTKDATPLVSVDFSHANSGYSTGTVTGGLEGHTENYTFATWRRIANVDDATLTAEAETYSALATNYFGGIQDFVTGLRNYLDTSVSSAENGFMMMSLYDQRTPYSGNFNAFIRIDNIDATDAGVIDVNFYQFYRKYYDYCYVDYSINNGSSWNEVEINVTGIDLDVNGQLIGFVTYTLPTAAAGHNVSIRIRYKSLDANRNAYGYFWALDDVTVTAGPENRFRTYAQEYVEGNYAMVPQGMTINPAWYTTILNTGYEDQTNVQAKIYHMDAAEQTTLIDSYNNGNLPTDTRISVIADRAGWMLADSLEYRGWYGYIDGTAHGTGMPLPTATAGDNFMFAQVSTDSTTVNYDTMYYQVTTPNSSNEYRWAHDNGLLIYSPYNYYVFGYVYVEPNWYVTSDPQDVEFYNTGYWVTNRYTTDQTVPEGWVVKGVEIVASPVEGYHATGAKLSAVLLSDAYEGNSVSFANVSTGANVKTVTDADVNDSNVIGRNSNGYLQQGQYNTVYIPFPEQPALTPNTVYRIGYAIEEPSFFAAAQEAQGYYRMASPTREGYDTIIYFANNDATAKYANFFTPNQYQVLINDPIHTERTTAFASAYEAYNPMIRMIVGPATEVVRHNIQVSCENTEGGTVYYAGREVCGETVTPAQGGSATFTADCAFGFKVAHCIVDGQEVQPWNEDTEEGDPNYHMYHDSVTNIWSASYTFSNIEADHTIQYTFEETVSIDPVAANVRLNLQPNPATSQVNLNIEGVEGMVNCMLIDMSGRVVYNQNLNAASVQTINVSNLAKGAYFVRVTNDKFSKVEKLIVR